MKKSILFLFANCICCLFVTAQISEGGIPPSFEYPSFLRSGQFDPNPNVLTASVDYDFDELRKEDRMDREIAAPLRVAVPVEVHVDINETGVWSTLPNGSRIWQQTIELPGAVGAIISYEEFYIPSGGKLFIYNDDHSQVLGAYTNQTNPSGGRFSTQMIYGNRFTLEYASSTSSTDQPRINIQRIGYMYDNENVNSLSDDLRATTPPTLTPNRAAQCMINVNCSEGDDWKEQKRGVALILMEFPYEYTDEYGQQKYLGWFGCTGSLINNTNNDGTPYMLSADHCFYKYLNYTYEADFATTQFYFNYEYPTCISGTEIPSGIKALIGSNLLVRLPLHTKSDGVLIELKNKVPNEWNPYYNGWDAGNAASTNGVLIHHPQLSVKKISTYTKTPVSTRYGTGNPVNSSWQLSYSATANGHSVSESGSSGSPLFNQNGLIIGTLTGGTSYCKPTEGYDQNSPDWFGKMWYHYNQSPVSNERMSKFLDKKGLNVTSWQGYDPNGGGAGISTEEESSVLITMFPNPVVDELYINAFGMIESVRIYDVFGRLVYNIRDCKSSTANLNVSDWSKGVYLFIVKTENGEFTEKIVKN